MTRRRVHLRLLVAAVAIIGGSGLLYRALAGPRMILIGAGTGTVALVVIAHLGLLAALLAAVTVPRRRARAAKA